MKLVTIRKAESRPKPNLPEITCFTWISQGFWESDTVSEQKATPWPPEPDLMISQVYWSREKLRFVGATSGSIQNPIIPTYWERSCGKKWTTRSCMLASSRCVACGAATAIPLESKTRSNSLAVKKNKPALVHRFLMRTKSSGTTRWRRWTVNVLEHDHKTVTSFHRTSKQRCCGALIITERNGLFRICLRNDWRKPWSIFIVI